MPNSVNDDGDVHIAKINRWVELFMQWWDRFGSDDDPQLDMYREAEMNRLENSMSVPAFERAQRAAREFME